MQASESRDVLHSGSPGGMAGTYVGIGRGSQGASHVVDGLVGYLKWAQTWGGQRVSWQVV